MKLSQETTTILKNFSMINQSILFKEGNVVKTISPQKTVMAMATVPDKFPRQAGIYNLPRFLSVCSMHENSELDFQDTYLTISEGNKTGRYIYADASMIIAPPDKEITLPSIDVSVDVSSADLQSILKAAGVYQLPEIAFVGEDGKCYLKAIDSSNPTADAYGIEVGNTDDEFSLIIKTENINVLPIDYKVELSAKGISKFTGKNVTYFIAIESKSKYSKG